jgi:hypothetical protein
MLDDSIRPMNPLDESAEALSLMFIIIINKLDYTKHLRPEQAHDP